MRQFARQTRWRLLEHYYHLKKKYNYKHQQNYRAQKQKYKQLGMYAGILYSIKLRCYYFKGLNHIHD